MGRYAGEPSRSRRRRVVEQGSRDDSPGSHGRPARDRQRRRVPALRRGVIHVWVARGGRRGDDGGISQAGLERIDRASSNNWPLTALWLPTAWLGRSRSLPGPEAGWDGPDVGAWVTPERDESSALR